MKKEEINQVFKENPELSNIGTKTQYYKYLETVFPESKVKNIVYHGTASKDKIQNFDLKKSNYANAIFFTDNLDFAKSFAYDEVRDGSVQEQLLNVNNSFDYTNKAHKEELRDIIRKLVKEGYQSPTGIKFRNDLPSINIGQKVIKNPTTEDFVDHYMWRLDNGSWRIIETDKIIDHIAKKYDSINVTERGGKNIAVFNPNQVHVLGSKYDADKFREYVKNNTKGPSLEKRIVSGIFILIFTFSLFLLSPNLTGNIIGISETGGRFIGIILFLFGISGFFIYKKLRS
jgi:hypothetical protein